MTTNLYHHLSFLPATESWEMPRGLEALALALVQSGKLRINADSERNFVRHDRETFTTRELTDATLAATTRARMGKHVAPAAGPRAVEELWALLRNELKKARGVAAEKELKVARVLVQSAAPEVVALLLKTGAEIYVSYAHTVADLMPVHEWQTTGENSGLQATDDAGAAVYVSCGGDPFFEGEHKTYTTDGFPSLARMVVIAGQELAHFADLRRRADGAVIGRHSTDQNASQLRASPEARTAREADSARVEALARAYARAGLGFLRRAEKGVAFYQKRWRYSPPWLFYQLWRALAWARLMIRCRRARLFTAFCTLPAMRLGEAIEAYIADMRYNLAPDAQVYRHPDPLVEEAIAVIEAVARVPQQVHKWGFLAVAAAWPALTEFYFGTVLPACRAQVGQDAINPSLTKINKIVRWLRRASRPRPGYYP